MSGAVFVQIGERFSAGDIARGPWDPGAQHGGAPASLIMRALERLGELPLVRVTYEFLRPVPIAELELRAEVSRPGKRVRLLEASLAADGTQVVRARALAVQPADAHLSAGDDVLVPPGPETGWQSDLRRMPFRPMFYPDAMEIRFVRGSFGGGPCTAWLRLRAEIVAGEEPSPLQRVAAAADFGNGISAELSWDEYLFVNPDLTLYVAREPVGEWVCLQARTRVVPGAGAIAESELFDQRGWIGRATQALLVARR